ncbi:nucleotidyltransferase domain-containing protein (plasmid) [Mycobacterium sp. SMC-8]|uniref:nucleotidyltransferase domain-containing protein n=1 Tax=Mycobacterium sp. SMC-8 TaxID=2857060 RepID=UPI0021B3D807|nr:nucleotidyltransferase domain-containing protein [Mycobacterium sp. SMC-8]UXA15806.1 nucleotidyltransferase domain-containing protein [Mycobacterium sp. SMC-8]
MNLIESISHLGLTGSTPGLTASAARSNELIERMRSGLAGHGADGQLDVVAFGSLARREYTDASDVDYLVIVNAMPDDPAAPRALVQRVNELIAAEADFAKATSKAPGTSGLFGTAAGIFDIVDQVGLEGDTNHTHTRRMEIVQESVSLLDPDLHTQILSRTIRRYLALVEASPDRPPRFLLNDMLRYWRQITIDYQAKAPARGQEPKAVLRYLKLLTTRKNLFASSVLPLIAPRDNAIPWNEYLNEVYALPPLARLATVTQSAPEYVREAVRTVFETIDLFVQRTDSKEKRAQFEAITWESRKDNAGYNEMKEAANRLQDAFENIFMGEWTEVTTKTRRYIVF